MELVGEAVEAIEVLVLVSGELEGIVVDDRAGDGSPNASIELIGLFDNDVVGAVGGGDH